MTKKKTLTELSGSMHTQYYEPHCKKNLWDWHPEVKLRLITL